MRTFYPGLVAADAHSALLSRFFPFPASSSVTLTHPSFLLPKIHHRRPGILGPYLSAFA